MEPCFRTDGVTLGWEILRTGLHVTRGEWIAVGAEGGIHPVRESALVRPYELTETHLRHRCGHARNLEEEVTLPQDTGICSGCYDSDATLR